MTRNKSPGLTAQVAALVVATLTGGAIVLITFLVVASALEGQPTAVRAGAAVVVATFAAIKGQPIADTLAERTEGFVDGA